MISLEAMLYFLRVLLHPLLLLDKPWTNTAEHTNGMMLFARAGGK